MKKIRILPLALALAMTLTLALSACSKAEPEPSTPIDAGILPPNSSGGGLMIIPVPTFSMDEEVPDAPTESADVVSPEESGNLAQPLESQIPTLQTQPIQTPPPEATPAATPAPTPEPTPEALPKAVTAADVYDKVFAVADSAASMEASFVLEDFYTVSESDLEDFVLYMPEMSTNIEEIFIAKVKNGKMDSVKAACQERQGMMAADAALYPATGGYVESYQLVTEGDWLLFCVCGSPDSAVAAFRDALK